MAEVMFEPSVMKWAREKSIGSTPQALASVLEKKWPEMSPATVGQWESGTNAPTFDEIKKLAGIYKRPLAVFFLDSPPTERSNPPDKRTIGSKDNKDLSPDALLIFRKARRVQRVTRDLLALSGQSPEFKYEKVPLTANPEKLAASIRADFGISIGVQFKTTKYEDFFEMVRAQIEATGVVTLKTGMSDKLAKEDARAVSFVDELPYLILINNRDTEGAKNFSLLHEFAHILLRAEAICNDFSNFSGVTNVETFCNAFAAAFLVPRGDFLTHELLVGKKTINLGDIDEIVTSIAKKFKVSRFVILRRLLTFRLIDNSTYEDKAAAWGDETPPKRKGGSFSVKSYLNKNGKKFSALVVTAYRQNKISRTRVADYLGFKTKHVRSFEGLFK